MYYFKHNNDCEVLLALKRWVDSIQELNESLGADIYNLHDATEVYLNAEKIIKNARRAEKLSKLITP